MYMQPKAKFRKKENKHQIKLDTKELPQSMGQFF